MTNKTKQKTKQAGYYYVIIFDKTREMPIKFKHNKDVLIFLYELHALFLAHLYELLSVVC